MLVHAFSAQTPLCIMTWKQILSCHRCDLCSCTALHTRGYHQFLHPQLSYWASQHKLLVPLHDLIERTWHKDMAEGQSRRDHTEWDREKQGEGKVSKSGTELSNSKLYKKKKRNSQAIKRGNKENITGKQCGNRKMQMIELWQIKLGGNLVLFV